MSEAKFRPGDTVYRAAHVTYRDDGPDVLVQIGTVSQCGEWVDVGFLRYPIVAGWHLRRCDAEESMADNIDRHAVKCLSRALELREVALRARAAT